MDRDCKYGGVNNQRVPDDDEDDDDGDDEDDDEDGDRWIEIANMEESC